MVTNVGIVFNFLQLPDVLNYPFVISKRSDRVVVKKGLFVYTNSVEGYLIGIIEKIILLNEYFSDALTIKAYNNENNPNILKGLFPSEGRKMPVNLAIAADAVESEPFRRWRVRLRLRIAVG